MLVPLCAASFFAPFHGQDPVDFDLDIRPLLVDRCFACHGPDASTRAADLRLDERAAAIEDRGSYAAIVPGDADSSELIARITSEFEFEQMPPPEAHKEPFQPHEIELIRRWIDDGATWSKHWAFEAPVKDPLPVDGEHPVDAFVLARLRAQGLDLAPEATPHVLTKRLSFDLTGLPPREHGGAKKTDADWLRLVDELLSSEQHAERLAMWWLDVARYADTDGFQADDVRTNWPWRDWVIDSFHGNMPFDEFTELQLAGDLRANATPQEILATCFQRNHMHNGEGGRDPEESRVDYVRDRTNTVGAVWLGLTLECAQCHDHKFDPVSQADYYALSAFFNSIDETGRAGGGAAPFLKLRSPKAGPAIALAELEHSDARTRLEELRSEAGPDFEAWLSAAAESLDRNYAAWTTLAPSEMSLEAGGGARLITGAGGSIERLGPAVEQDTWEVAFEPVGLRSVAGLELSVYPSESGALGGGTNGDFAVTGLSLHVLRDGTRFGVDLNAAVQSAMTDADDGLLGRASGALDDDPRTGWRVAPDPNGEASGVPAVARFSAEAPFELVARDRLQIVLEFRSQIDAAYPLQLRVRATDSGGPVARELGPSALEDYAALLSAEVPESPALPAALPAALRARLLDHYLEEQPEWRSAAAAETRFAAQLKAARAAAGELSVTVLRERSEPRPTRVLLRGEWDKQGDIVQRGFPAAVFEREDGKGEGALSRLDLARWLTDDAHPLTARVIVNQVWQMLFGAGLVRTPADFGLQGQRPLYPELLDWLAVDFIESGWDLRHLIRTIVTSRTYRQSSVATAEELARDPENEQLARGARFRLPSWMIRDSALATSGLLDDRVGGPPVFPHQPPGVWEELFMGRFRYQPTLGAAQYRRSLYAFWRRNSSPTFLFDTADRRTCAVDLRRTNTPLQALTLLNDQTFVDASDALAQRVAAEHTGTRERLDAVALAVLGRPLGSGEGDVAYEMHQKASALTGDSLSALSAVAAVFFNLDEAITHE